MSATTTFILILFKVWLNMGTKNSDHMPLTLIASNAQCTILWESCYNLQNCAYDSVQYIHMHGFILNRSFNNSITNKPVTFTDSAMIQILRRCLFTKNMAHLAVLVSDFSVGTFNLWRNSLDLIILCRNLITKTLCKVLQTSHTRWHLF